MSDWIVIPCLLCLQAEFDKLNPNRDKGAEGFVGDSSHTSSSDHTPDEDSDKLRDKDSDHVNEVHAYDCDSTGPWPGTNFKAIVMKVIEGEKKKWNDPNDKCRLNYVIYDRVIYDKDNDFIGVPYTGDDPHTNHAHFSARYETSCENDTRPWGIVATFGDDVSEQDVTNALNKFFKVTQQANAEKLPESRIGHDASVQGVPDTINGGSTYLYRLVGDIGKQLMVTQKMVVDLTAKVDAHIAGLIEPAKDK